MIFIQLFLHFAYEWKTSFQILAGENFSPSTSQAASFIQKVWGFKNIKPQILTYIPSEVWGLIERGK